MYCVLTVAALLTARPSIADDKYDHLLTDEMKLKMDWDSLKSIDFYLETSRCRPAYTILRGMKLQQAEPYLRGSVKVYLCEARRDPKNVDVRMLKRALEALGDLEKLVPDDAQISKQRSQLEAELRALSGGTAKPEPTSEPEEEPEEEPVPSWSRKPSRNPMEGLTHLKRNDSRSDGVSIACERASCKGKYVREYFYYARKGDIVSLRVEGTPGTRFVMSGGYSLPACADTLQPNKISICGWDEPMKEDTEVYIRVQAGAPGHQVRLQISGNPQKTTTVAPPVATTSTSSPTAAYARADVPPAKPRRSKIAGLRAGLSFAALHSSFDEIDDSDSGKGLNLRAAYGATEQLEIFLGYDHDRRADEQYKVSGYTFGVRYYAKDETVAVRPYLEGALGPRERVVESGDIEISDSTTAYGVGGGAMFFASPILSVDAGLFLQKEGFESSPTTTYGARLGFSLHIGGIGR